MAFWSKDKGEKDAVQDPSAFVAKKDYPRAIALYRAQIASQPKNYMLRHKVADVLCMAGKEKDSLADYSAAADGYAREGFLIKAVAILKKMQKVDPSNASVESRLSQLSAAGASSSSSTGSSSSGESSPDAGTGSRGEELSLDMEMIDDSASIPLSSMDEGSLPPGPLPGPAAATVPPPADMVSTPLFSELEPEELRGVVARLRHRAFAPGSTLVKEGDPGASLFVLSDGRVKVTTRGPRGKPVQLAELKEGDFFGEVSLLTGKPRTATITSVEPTEVLELTREDLEDLETRHPRIRDVIRDFYEKRVASTIEAMIQASRASKGPSGG